MTAWRSWGAAQRGPFRPFELEQARRGAAAGLPTRALPQPARWVASDQTGSQPHYHGHPIRPGVVPPGHQSTVGKGVGCAASQAGLASPPGRVPPHRHLARPLDAELLRQDAQGHGGTPPPRHGVGSAPHTPAEETSLEALPSFCLGLGALTPRCWICVWEMTVNALRPPFCLIASPPPDPCLRFSPTSLQGVAGRRGRQPG